MNVYEFLNVLLWAAYPRMVIYQEQCIFIIHDPTGRERNNFQQLAKLIIELKFISTTWPHWLTLTSKVAHQQICSCPKSFLITQKTLKLT